MTASARLDRVALGNNEYPLNGRVSDKIACAFASFSRTTGSVNQQKFVSEIPVIRVSR